KGASPITVSVPNSVPLALPFEIRQVLSGNITLTPDAGMVLNGELSTDGINSELRVLKIGDNECDVSWGVLHQQGSYRTLIVTDIHMKAFFDTEDGSETGAVNTPLNRYYYTSPDLMRQFVDKVNEIKPNLVLCLGDMCDNPEWFDEWNVIWGGINPSIRKELIPGNHDLDNLTFAELVTATGMDGKSVTAGSPFNQIIELGDDVLYILTDTTFDTSDNHTSNYQYMRMHTSTPAWIQNILETCIQTNIIIAGHSVPSLNAISSDKYNLAQATLLKNMVSGVVAARPELKIEWMCGHHHVPNIVRNSTYVDNPVILMPAMILGRDGMYVDVNQDKESSVLNEKTLAFRDPNPAIRGLFFNGSSDFAELGTKLHTVHSIAIQIDLRFVNKTMYFIGANSTNPKMGIRYNGSLFNILSSLGEDSSIGMVNDSNPVNLIFTMDSDEKWRIYSNGVLLGKTINVCSIMGVSLLASRITGPMDLPFKGAISKFAIWNRTLFDNECTSLDFENIPLDPDLKVLYDFSEGSGTVLNDTSGNGNNATIHGATWL
ncbi:MAG TPA: metallophosphoesterase, partial [Thermoclostridium sp.]|nr:metallophosphoesterase [Thermoclostridium sp.]